MTVTIALKIDGHGRQESRIGLEFRRYERQGAYPLQNGFMGAPRSLLFYGEFSEAAVQIPVTCYLIRTSDATILFDTGMSPRAVPGLMRTDRLAKFTEADKLVHRLDAAASRRTTSTSSCSPTCTTITRAAPSSSQVRAGRAEGRVQFTRTTPRRSSRLLLPQELRSAGYRWRLLDGDTELAPGVTVLRTDGQPPGHQSIMVELPETGPVILRETPVTGTSTSTTSASGRGVESHARSPLHQASEDPRPADGAKIFPSHDPSSGRP
jgi:hypothetical protein